MRKIVMYRTGGPDVLEMAGAPEPQPGPGEVVVQAEAIGVGWPDILIRRGSYKWMPPLPTSPGSDLAGRVVALGSGVDAAMLGRSVLLTARELKVRGGCYAEQVAVPAEALFCPKASISMPPSVCRITRWRGICCMWRRAARRCAACLSMASLAVLAAPWRSLPRRPASACLAASVRQRRRFSQKALASTM